ncbi:MAG: AMP-binding protein [Burkholderiaceae bacterium]|nr:AMP-binding protein [Burkholderiaceae bacterium]
MLVHDIPTLAAHNAAQGVAPDAAIHFEGDSIGYADFAHHCQRLSQALAAAAPHGARIAVLSANRIEFLAAYFAIPAAGQVMVPINTRLGPREVAHILDDAEPALLLVEAAWLPLLAPWQADHPDALPIVVLGEPPAGLPGYDAWLAAAPAAALPQLASDDDPAWLLYTSGTTGRAKGALLSHRNLVTAMLNTLVAFDLGRREVALFMFPMFHIAGYALLGYLLRGYPVVLMRGFEVEGYLAAVQRHRITHHAIAPTMLAMVLEHPRIDAYDTASLRSIAYGASAMPAEVIRAAMARWPGVGFGTTFGMTELAGNVLYLGRDEHQRALDHEPSVLAACGLPMPLARVRIVDDDGRDLPDGQAGELAVRGDQVFTGYWRNDAANQASFRDGWFLTGDIGRRDTQGRVYIVDRKKDMIISGGENIYSREVENLLYEHPAVAEVAVVGQRHPTWGEQVVALVRLREGAAADAATLDAFCKQRIGGYKRPRRYVFLAALPKSAAGKILKAELRRQLQAGEFDKDSPA